MNVWLVVARRLAAVLCFLLGAHFVAGTSSALGFFGLCLAIPMLCAALLVPKTGRIAEWRDRHSRNFGPVPLRLSPGQQVARAMTFLALPLLTVMPDLDRLSLDIRTGASEASIHAWFVLYSEVVVGGLFAAIVWQRWVGLLGALYISSLFFSPSSQAALANWQIFEDGKHVVALLWMVVDALPVVAFTVAFGGILNTGSWPNFTHVAKSSPNNSDHRVND
jgi:hypothetical protein